jgi:flagellar hook-associated protein 3 FlgL
MMIYNSSKYELSRTLADYNAAASTVTTGKRIQSPSDDPVGYAQVLDIEGTLSQMDQLHSNLDTGLEWLSTSESTLNSVLDTISEAKQLSIAATNGIYNDDDYQNAAAEVDELLEQLVDFANTSVSGHYLFSGTKTDTIPYTLDETAAQPITYSGNENAFTISTGSSSRTEVSYTGTEVFGEVGVDTDGNGIDDDLFSLLIAMRDDLELNNGANLDTIMGELDEHYETVNNLLSDVGIKTNRLETKESVVSDFELTLEEQKSNIEDVDLTEAATDLALRETAYQAALSATSSIISISLVDYI